MKFLSTIASICLIALLAACSSQPAKPQMTSLEIQAIQAKNFDVDKKTSFDSSLSVLQDLGYIIVQLVLKQALLPRNPPQKALVEVFFSLVCCRFQFQVLSKKQL